MARDEIDYSDERDAAGGTTHHERNAIEPRNRNHEIRGMRREVVHMNKLDRDASDPRVSVIKY